MKHTSVAKTSQEKYFRILAVLIGIFSPFIFLTVIELSCFGIYYSRASFDERSILIAEFHPLLCHDEECVNSFRNPHGVEVRDNYEFDSTRGYRLEPNSRIPVGGDNIAELGVDAYGFVHNGDPKRDLSVKPPGVYRIFTVGGVQHARNRCDIKFYNNRRRP